MTAVRLFKHFPQPEHLEKGLRTERWRTRSYGEPRVSQNGGLEMRVHQASSSRTGSGLSDGRTSPSPHIQMAELWPSEGQLLAQRHTASHPDLSQCLVQSPKGTLQQEPLSALGTSWELASVLNLACGNLSPDSPKPMFPRSCTAPMLVTLNVAATLVKFAMLPPMMRILPKCGSSK